MRTQTETILEGVARNINLSTSWLGNTELSFYFNNTIRIVMATSTIAFQDGAFLEVSGKWFREGEIFYASSVKIVAANPFQNHFTNQMYLPSHYHAYTQPDILVSEEKPQTRYFWLFAIAIIILISLFKT